MVDVPDGTRKVEVDDYGVFLVAGADEGRDLRKNERVLHLGGNLHLSVIVHDLWVGIGRVVECTEDYVLTMRHAKQRRPRYLRANEHSLGWDAKDWAHKCQAANAVSTW